MQTLNIFTSLNGVGLERDYRILQSLIESKYNVHCVDYLRHAPFNDSEVAIHLEIPRFEHLNKAKRNIFIPNPEWFYPHWHRELRMFDEIWCKTYDALNIFKQFHVNVKYCGFMTNIAFDEQILKKKTLLHVAGQSQLKNTQTLCEAYEKYSDLSLCYLVSSKQWPAKNNLVPCGRLQDEDFDILINSCLIHVCPSTYEGYGHYIHEAKACANVVITTDAAPMNEFITDKRFLIPVKTYGKLRLGKTAVITKESLANKIYEVSQMSISELIEVGKANRLHYLQQEKKFKEFIKSELL